MDQQKIIQFQLIEQEAQQLNQQLQVVEQHVLEMQKLKDGLETLENSKEKKILAGIGKGMYVPAEITDKKLIVEVGNKNLVKKSIPDAKKLIDEQLKKLDGVKKQILAKTEELQAQMMMLMQEVSKEK